jgi:hypothetical protein
MALSFAEALKRLEEGRQHRAVWNYVVDYLSKLVDTEVREATGGIPAEGCVAKYVDQKIVSEIIRGIEADKVSPLDEEIETLENLEVVETKKDGNKEKPKKAGGRKASKKNTQGIRAVPRAARGAAK